MKNVGIHCFLELSDCPGELLNDAGFIEEALREATREAGATLLREVSFAFEPHGITAVGILAESHISIHTWPEFSYVAADIFTCGQTAKPEKACEYLVRVFRPRSHTLRKLNRGPDGGVAGAVSQPPTPQRQLSREKSVSIAKEEGSGDGEEDPCPAPTFARISG